MSLHGVKYVESYLDRMEGGASNGGLWVDFTIFFWLSKFIKWPRTAWSTRTCRPYMNVGDKFNMNEKLTLAYHEGMNDHFEQVKRLETHNSSLNNNISNMQKKIMQQSIIFNCYNIKFHNMKKKDVMNRFVKQ